MNNSTAVVRANNGSNIIIRCRNSLIYSRRRVRVRVYLYILNGRFFLLLIRKCCIAAYKNDNIQSNQTSESEPVAKRNNSPIRAVVQVSLVIPLRRVRFFEVTFTPGWVMRLFPCTFAPASTFVHTFPPVAGLYLWRVESQSFPAVALDSPNKHDPNPARCVQDWHLAYWNITGTKKTRADCKHGSIWQEDITMLLLWLLRYRLYWTQTNSLHMVSTGAVIYILDCRKWQEQYKSIGCLSVMKRWRITLSQLSNISRSRAVVASKKKDKIKHLRTHTFIKLYRKMSSLGPHEPACLNVRDIITNLSVRVCLCISFPVHECVCA